MFKPNFSITPKIATILMKIQQIKDDVDNLPITPQVLANLRKTAKIYTTHYSTMIEGNRLTTHEIQQTIFDHIKIKSRERDQKEVLGYYTALDYIESIAKQRVPMTESIIKTIHALVMGGGKSKVSPTHYRDGQNVIKDRSTGNIVYLPPEAQDVHPLMHEMVTWLEREKELPCPLRAAIAHYQIATIHPYYDGNGRTARLLASLILQSCGFGLKGIYSLEEYYAVDLPSYYQALSIGPSHNYYFGRAETDITPWLEYFCAGLITSFEKVKKQALQAARRGEVDQTSKLIQHDSRKRLALSHFQIEDVFTSRDLEKLLNVSARTARGIAQKWVAEGFIKIVNTSKKCRTYMIKAATE